MNTGNSIPVPQSLLGTWAVNPARFSALANQIARGHMLGLSARPSVDEDDGYTVSNGVAVIEIRGAIMKSPTWMDCYYGAVADSVELAQVVADADEDDEVKAMLLVIESPGGMVAGTAELATAVAGAGKPVVTFFEDMGCSAAYWIGAMADRVFANAGADVGCIGVYAVLTDTSQFWQNVGIQFTTVSSGGVKGLGADGKISPELVAEVQRGVDGSNALFLAAISEGRGFSEAEAKAVATGQVWMGQDLIDNGLVDQIGTIQEAMDAAVSAGKQSPSTRNAQTKSPQQIIAAEWATNKANCKERFVSREIYTRIRLKEFGVPQQSTADRPGSAPPPMRSEIDDQARAEWARNHGKCKQAFISESVYVNVRRRELKSIG